MNRLTRAFVLLMVTAVVLSTNVNRVDAQGFDRIRHRNGSDSGKITKVNALGVTITKGGVDKKMPVQDIITITFAGEPEQLARGRKLANARRYEEALERLQEIDSADVDRLEIEQEIEFYTILSQTRLALSGRGSIDASLNRVKKFLSANSRSYHVPAAIELLGDVLMVSGDYKAARQEYAKLGKAPAPYFKARSAYLTGLSFKAAGEHQEAVEAFDAALKAGEGNSRAKSLQLEATLHRAVSQAALGDATQSTQAVKQIITQTDAEDTARLAEAYNALGDCYLQAGDKKSALHAFLHVDVLFSSAVGEHAKALYELFQLWKESGKATRATDAQQRLKEKYPSSQWARK